ncbi:MAG TPA: hypothetical protein PKL92_01970 [Aquaticitalea sp.]|nr:hypothetical protein [Aquaticitalea sp.]
MKKLTIILLFVSCFVTSCQRLQNNDELTLLQHKIDSLIEQKNLYESSDFYKFHSIYEQENGSISDTSLVKKYQSIIGNDEVINTYIYHRIYSILNSVNQKEQTKKFEGKYELRTIGLDESSPNKVIIARDSCYLYKDKELLASDRINFIYIGDDFNVAKFRIDRFYVGLLKPNLIYVRDNLCMDCPELEFRK